VLLELQLGCLLSCNLSDKIFKNIRKYCIVLVSVLDRQAYPRGTWGRWLWWGLPDLELESTRKDTGHKIYTGPGCQGGEPYVLSGISIYSLSWKYWELSAWYYTPLQLQPDSSSSCNWYTLWVANTERFRLILYHPLSCNQLVVRVAIDVHSELQIPSAFSCNRTVVRVAINVHSELQILRASAWYYTTPPLQLQPDSGSSCNWYTLRVANTKRFCLILYYPFSCNPIVVGLPSCN
jgi:hypothetical protein